MAKHYRQVHIKGKTIFFDTNKNQCFIVRVKTPNNRFFTVYIESEYPENLFETGLDAILTIQERIAAYSDIDTGDCGFYIRKANNLEIARYTRKIKMLSQSFSSAYVVGG